MKLSNPYTEVESTKASMSWEGEAIFRTGLVEVGEVHAHPPFFVGLLHQDHVCQPIEGSKLP
jgi:hypothetical protein